MGKSYVVPTHEEQHCRPVLSAGLVTSGQDQAHHCPRCLFHPEGRVSEQQGTVLKAGDLDQAVKVLGPCFVTTKASKEKSTF